MGGRIDKVKVKFKNYVSLANRLKCTIRVSFLVVGVVFWGELWWRIASHVGAVSNVLRPKLKTSTRF